MKCYDDMIRLPSFEERFHYLKLTGQIGRPTFGHERWMNQRFYRSREWKRIRDFIISRDNGFDLGSSDHPILGKIIIHHMVPLTPDAIEHGDETILDPQYLISCSLDTHNAIHFGDESAPRGIVERRPNDTCPWKVQNDQ